jgi:hypothetical protein
VSHVLCRSNGKKAMRKVKGHIFEFWAQSFFFLHCTGPLVLSVGTGPSSKTKTKGDMEPGLKALFVLLDVGEGIHCMEDLYSSGIWR